MINAVGMSWYSPEDYDSLRSLFKDGDQLPDTYDEWLLAANRGVETLQNEGQKVLRIPLSPNEFVELCRIRKCDLDANGRKLFAATKAAEAVRG